MRLKQLVQQLATIFDLTLVDSFAAGTTEIEQAQLGNNDVRQFQEHVLFLNLVTAHQVKLSYYDQGQLQRIGVLQLTVPKKVAVGLENQLMQVLFKIGEWLALVQSVQTTINQLAINAITADFDTVLDQTVQLLKNPVAIIDLNGQILSRSHTTQINGASISAAVEQNQIGRWLLEHGFAPGKRDFLTQIYVAQDNLASGPMLIAPLAHQGEPIGYLVMPAIKTPLNATHALLISGLSQVLAGSLVKNQIMPTAESQRDRLINVLLTERQSTTFAAQFAEQHAILPDAMVIIKCEPLAGQSARVLQQRLQYLLAPQFSQVLVSVYQHNCVALVSLSLAAYNSPDFKERLMQAANHTDCRFIVSNFYQQPEDTFAAYTVCTRTAKLQTYHDRVVFCEDEFFNLSLARVNHIEILPFFINPALKVLIAYDAKNRTNLVPTLDAYLEATCNLTRTAKELYVHPNTLRNRLKHISKLTGCDLRDAETCFKLASGFKLRRFLVKNNYQSTLPLPKEDPQPAARH